MSGWIAWDESTPFTAEQMEVMTRKAKIQKLADMLRQIKYPVFPSGATWADFGIQFDSHVYEFIAEYLIDHGVEVDIVRCKECEYYAKDPHSCVCGLHSEKSDCFNGGFDMQMLPNDFCSYGERRGSSG